METLDFAPVCDQSDRRRGHDGGGTIASWPSTLFPADAWPPSPPADD